MNFKVGDQVTVFGHGWSNEISEIRTVARVAGRKVVDDKGGEWLARTGRQWGAVGTRAPFIHATDPSHADEIERRRLRAKLSESINGVLRAINSCSDLSRVRGYVKAAEALLAFHRGDVPAEEGERA